MLDAQMSVFGATDTFSFLKVIVYCSWNGHCLSLSHLKQFRHTLLKERYIGTVHRDVQRATIDRIDPQKGTSMQTETERQGRRFECLTVKMKLNKP
jgi:hypothetical protein